VSSAYNGGSRVLRLKRQGDKVVVEELWAHRRVRIHFGNGVRLGTLVLASNGDFGAAPFAAVDVKTGDLAWRDRSVTRSTLIAAGDKLIILDEDGTLALATPSETGLTVHAKAPVLSGRAWTVPTLSGTTLYLRDSTQIIALDLGPPSPLRASARQAPPSPLRASARQAPPSPLRASARQAPPSPLRASARQALFSPERDQRIHASGAARRHVARHEPYDRSRAHTDAIVSGSPGRTSNNRVCRKRAPASAPAGRQ
jgi:hypothetical protein